LWVYLSALDVVKLDGREKNGVMVEISNWLLTNY
jgi:hypothetical protein